MSIITTILSRCPHCGIPDVACYHHADCQPDNSSFSVSFWTCAHCKHGICIESKHVNVNARTAITGFIAMYPSADAMRAPEHSPPNIAQDFQQAKMCAKGGNFKAAALMARVTVEAVLNDIGAEGRDLRTKIESLAHTHAITPSMAEWAQAVRTLGNDAAHDPGPVTEAEAVQAVYFAEVLLTYIFTLPTMVAEHRAGT